jgi:hypothetical protein
MAHRARRGDVAVEMVSRKANKEMRWEMTLVTNNREPIGMLKL